MTLCTAPSWTSSSLQMTLDAWLVGLSSGIAVFAFVFSLLTCTLFCCRDSHHANSQEEKNDNVPEAYTEEIKRLLSRCDSVESARNLRSQFPSRNASPSLHRAGSRISRFKDPLSVPVEHSRIDEENESFPKDITTSTYENYKVEDETVTPNTIVNCPAKVILPSAAPLHNSPKLMLPKLSVTSPSFTNLVLLEGDGESEGDERTPLVRDDTVNDLPIIPNLRKSEERADNEMWEAKRRTWRGIVDAVDGPMEDSLPSSSTPLSPSSPLPPSISRSISPVASVNVTATMPGCEVGVQTSSSSRPLFTLESQSTPNETVTALRLLTRMGY